MTRQEICDPVVVKTIMCRQLILVKFKSFLGVSGFECMKETKKVADAL